MEVETRYLCDNCNKEIKQKNAKFETSPDTFRAGYEFDTPIESYETVLCSKCYANYQEKSDRSSYKEPDIDKNAYPN